jgi:hypothetical protein
MYMQPDKECDNKVHISDVTIATNQMHSCLFAIYKFSDYLGSEYPMSKSYIKF